MKPSKNKIFCHDCGRQKQVFETKKKAENFIKFNSNDIELENGYAPKRSYFCVACGAWHITSNENEFQGKSLTEKVLEKYTIECQAKQAKQEINQKLEIIEKWIKDLLKRKYGNDNLKYKEILNYAITELSIVKKSTFGKQNRKDKIELQLNEIKLAIDNGSFFESQHTQNNKKPEFENLQNKEKTLSKEQKQKIIQSIKFNIEVLDASKNHIDIKMFSQQLASVNFDFDSVKDCWTGGQKLKNEIESKLSILDKYKTCWAEQPLVVSETVTLCKSKTQRKLKQTDEAPQDADNKITVDTVLFFDMDGTLIDTNYANFLSYKKAILTVTKSDHRLIYIPSRRFNRSNLKNSVPNLTESEYEKIIIEKEKHYNDFLHETKLNTKIADILFKYSKTNKTVLVTNCRKDRAIKTLNHFGLEDKFSDVFYREFGHNDKKINKFQNAITKLDVSPNLVIAFENEESEIADAQEAGISIINPLYL